MRLKGHRPLNGPIRSDQDRHVQHLSELVIWVQAQNVGTLELVLPLREQLLFAIGPGHQVSWT